MIQVVMPNPFVLSLVGIVVLYIAISRYFLRVSRYPFPPGPPGEPILGHVRVVPSENLEVYYQQLSKEYHSDVLFFKQFRTPVVVLNSVKAAEELLNVRGANYCDRPRFVLFEVMGWGLTLTFLPWGPRFKAHRSLIQKSFTKSNCVQYQGIQEEEARQAVSSILRNPAGWEMSFRRFASAVVLRIAFGVNLTEDNDPYIKIAIDANMATGDGGSPGTTIVDYFPFLARLPSWIKYSSAVEHARSWGWAIRRLHDIPFAAARKDFELGKLDTETFLYPLLANNSANISQGIPNNLTLRDINGAAAAIFIAGSDTTYNTILVGILNLLLNPHVFVKARALLDQVIGPSCLPSLTDRNNPELRYLDYIVEEISRWRPLSPLGVPHKSLKDDIYNGMFIPGGSSVYFNAYAMSRDESIYHDPELFEPERYVPTSEGGAGEPFLQAPFGFGRRVCPGRYLAQASVWITLATLIATTDIGKPVGFDGKEIEPVVNFSSGLSSHPAKFDVVFKPRADRPVSLSK